MDPVADCIMGKIGHISQNHFDSLDVSYPGILPEPGHGMTDAVMSSLPSVIAHISYPMRVWYCLIFSSLHSSEVSNSGSSDSLSGGLAFLGLEPKGHLYVSRIF